VAEPREGCSSERDEADPMTHPTTLLNSGAEVLLYRTEDGRTRMEVRFEGETAWLSVGQMAELFQRDSSVISRHIKNVFEEGELRPKAVVAKFASTALDGKVYYATSIDYEPNINASRRFFATVQNKMHWAAHGNTAAEIVAARADATKPNMGLTSWLGEVPRKLAGSTRLRARTEAATDAKVYRNSKWLSERVLVGYAEWTAKEIDARQASLKDFAMRRWKLSPPAALACRLQRCPSLHQAGLDNGRPLEEAAPRDARRPAGFEGTPRCRRFSSSPGTSMRAMLLSTLSRVMSPSSRRAPTRTSSPSKSVSRTTRPSSPRS
jgi:hypothetical protein